VFQTADGDEYRWLQARLKGALVTRLARPEVCVINTHPVANYDGDWSEGKGDVDRLLQASHRIHELGNGVEVSNRVSDVAIEIERSRDGSLVVFPAAPT
jgi:hypothetical protein